MGGLNLGDLFPDFDVETTEGSFKLHNWIGAEWALLFSHPRDFTPVCTTELAKLADLIPEFEKRKCKVIALSCDSVEEHVAWIKDINHYGKRGEKPFPYPIICDSKRELAVKLGMLDAVAKDEQGMPFTCRAVFIVGPDKKLRLSFLYPATTGRNFTEILRALDSVQLTENQKLATPVDWKVGDRCIVPPTVKDEDLAKLYPKGVDKVELPSGKSYLRYTMP